MNVVQKCVWIGSYVVFVNPLTQTTNQVFKDYACRKPIIETNKMKYANYTLVLNINENK